MLPRGEILAWRADHAPWADEDDQFNVVRAETLRAAQADPDAHRDLIVRVAGYSDYFCDISPTLQDEIISRTEHASA
jgi:pyruvate-formate lyase